ncbi:MAG: PorT family protein [Chitinophagales bacterium]|nr:PorT family protein [Chitinophagales bacterium]MDW8419262.1 porin family protein [Chitinophagales bacterium]
MTKLHIACLCGVCLYVTGKAQEGFHLGVAGAFNSTWILNQNNYGTLAPFTNYLVRSSEMDYRFTWGGQAGIALGYNFTRNWGIQAEILYNFTGQRYEDNFEGPAIIPQGTFGSAQQYVNVKRNISLQYLQIPVMARFISSGSNTVRFTAALGPQVGFRTRAREEVYIAGYPYDTLALPPKEKFRPVDFGLALQAGAEIYATDNLYLDVGLNVYGGLTDINGQVLRTLGWYSQNDVKYQKSYNFRIGLMAGIHYLFGRGREY